MFTKSQIEEIQRKLASIGYKDTDFEFIGIEEINGTEYIAVVHNGENVRIRLSDLEDYVINDGIPDLSQIRANAASGANAMSTANAAMETASSAINVAVAARDAVAGKQNKLTFDSTPRGGSSNPVTSNGIFNAIQNASGTGEMNKIDIIKVNGNTLPIDDNKAVDIPAVQCITVNGHSIWVGPRAEYESLTPSDDVIYFIKENQ